MATGMILISDDTFENEQFCVWLQTIPIRDSDTEPPLLQDGDHLIPLREYNRVVNEDVDLLQSLYPESRVLYALVYEYSGHPVVRYRMFNQQKQFVCNAWVYGLDYEMPVYKFRKEFGTQITP